MTRLSRPALVRALFDKARALPGDARERFLSESCRDEAVRREVLELLAMDEAGDRDHIFTEPGDREGAEWLAAELESATDDDRAAPPRTIGPYTIEREIGRGGMGIVYEASQRQPSRRVAIKVMNPHILGRSGMRRFRREMQALAQLRHPGIVQVIDAGSEPDAQGGSRPYMVMELVEGRSLRAYLREDRPGVAERLQLVAMICDAVTHAHQRGIVHRDLTPDNIMVHSVDPGTSASGTVAGTGVQPKILDFGVCRLLETETDHSAHTVAGQVVGTVPYLSPEQAAGDPTMTDTRSDVYALGVIAYEMLTGRRPFEVDGLPVAAALKLMLTTEPRRLGALDRSLRGDIETMIHKAAAREPDDRYQSAAAFAIDLRRYLSSEPILARPPTLRYVTGRFIRRNRGLSAAVAASLLVLVVSLAVVTMFWSEARATREASLWQTYIASMSAASLSVAEGDVAAARRHLAAAPSQHQGWEYRHLVSRLDESVRVVTPSLPPPMKPPFSLAPGAHADEMILVNSRHSAVLSLATGSVGPGPASRLCVWLGAQASRFPDLVPLQDASLAAIDPDSGAERAIQSEDFESAHISRARLSADGRVLAFFLVEHRSLTGSRVCVLDTASGAVRTVYPGGPRYVQGLALTRDGARVAFSMGDRDQPRATVRILDLNDATICLETPELRERPISLAFDPEGRRLYVHCVDGTLDLWDVSGDTPELLRRVRHSFDASLSLCVSPDGRLVAAGSRDRRLHVLDADTLDIRFEFLGHDAEVQDARFAEDSASLWTVDTSGVIREWDVRSGPLARPGSSMVLRGHTDLVHPVAISRRRNQAVVGSWDRSVSVYSLETGERVAHAPVPSLVIDLALSPDEQTLVTREYAHMVRVWDAATLAPLASFPHRTHRLDEAHFDRTGRRFVLDLMPEEGAILVADIAAGTVAREPLAALAGFDGPTIDHGAGVFVHVDQSPGTFRLIAQSYKNGRVLFTTDARRTAVEAFAYSDDRARLAVQGLDDRIRIYDARTFELQKTLTGHTREVLDTVFSPDGRRLFSADLTGVIRVWDLATGDEVAQLRGHTGHIRRLAISRDGQTLISGSRDGTARVWTAPPPASPRTGEFSAIL
ncbi:MAG: protein kinase [Planctomycetota bacterium]|nr:protein kinase [Planctomycetota bacterium]